LKGRSSLALYGGTPVRKEALSVMHPGATYYDNEEIKAVTEVLRYKSPYRFYGPRFLGITAKFEEEFASYVDTKYALAVSSGTAALHTALVGLGVGPGTEVILPTYGWVSCPAAIVAAGGTPVLANVDDSLTLDAADVKRRITPRTRQSWRSTSEALSATWTGSQRWRKRAAYRSSRTRPSAEEAHTMEGR
jgi:8-amino-3,8-dideoxy-alpha-D-manno-octulosonate transaminase